MRTLFLADAHLRQPTDINYRALLAFLDEQCGKTDQLVLLGDIFHFWIGKNHVAANYVPVIEALERMIQQGTKLVYVEGNHDFHMGPVFTRRLKGRVFPDGGTIQLGEKNVFLAHGDMTNPADTGYHRLRSFLRSGLIRTLIRIVPSFITMAIANSGSSKSREHSDQRRVRWPARELLLRFAEEQLAAGHQAVVTGHYHQPFHDKLANGELIALGDWIDQYSYAVYENQAFTLKRYSPPSSTDSITS